jgi:hypothetical protein
MAECTEGVKQLWNGGGMVVEYLWNNGGIVVE